MHKLLLPLALAALVLPTVYAQTAMPAESALTAAWDAQPVEPNEIGRAHV